MCKTTLLNVKYVEQEIVRKWHFDMINVPNGLIHQFNYGKKKNNKM